MGSDDLHKKHKALRARQDKRVKENREQKTRILILCEGETEVEYVSAIIRPFKQKFIAEISSKCPTCPLGIIEKAMKITKYDPEFEKVFILFDCDVVTPEKMEKVNQIAGQQKFHLIKSDPCFEYWLLLHFKYTRKPYLRLDDKSSCEQVISDLKTISGMESYDKVKSINLPLLTSNLENAILHSRRSVLASNEVNVTNPSSNMYELVVYIQNI